MLRASCGTLEKSHIFGGETQREQRTNENIFQEGKNSYTLILLRPGSLAREKVTWKLVDSRPKMKKDDNLPWISREERLFSLAEKT